MRCLRNLFTAIIIQVQMFERFGRNRYINRLIDFLGSFPIKSYETLCI